jgi:hypothetical protein
MNVYTGGRNMQQVITKLVHDLMKSVGVSVCLVISVSVGSYIGSLSINPQSGKMAVSAGYRSGDITRTGETCIFKCGQEVKGVGSTSFNQAVGPAQGKLSMYDDGRKAAFVSVPLFQECKGPACLKVGVQGKITYDSKK